MKNIILLMVIYTENEPSADYAQRWGGKMRKAVHLVKIRLAVVTPSAEVEQVYQFQEYY